MTDNNAKAIPIAPDDAPAVALVPYYLKVRGAIADLPLDDLDWPDGRPTRLARGRVGDMAPDDHLFTYPRSWAFWRSLKGMRARFSLMIVEPRSFHFQYMFLARKLHRRFFRVLSCNGDLLSAIPNGRYFVFGNTWVEDWRDKDVTKTRMTSLIASKKRDLTGHKLRHSVAARLRAASAEVDLMGGGYHAFADKADGLAPYRYSVVIENTREPGYFTEKLVDALLLKTVPIYWGAPDIGTFFDTEGMIICESETQLVRAVETASQTDYQRRMTAIEANRLAAVKYADVLKSAARVLRAEKPA